MKTQVSRDSYDPDKRYSGVYLQQGRMITDADWNEEAEIARARLDDALHDTVTSGIPRERGLTIEAKPGQPLQLRSGRLYAEGVGAVVARAPSLPTEPFRLDQQADLPLPQGVTPPTTDYRLYADVWERTVTSLEEPEQLRDPAFHGADTASRMQTMAQLKWCASGIDPEDPDVNPPIGDARLTLTLRRHSVAADPCDPCASEILVGARVGNYLFRLEVHAVEGPPKNPTQLVLKWSSENGAEQHAVRTQPADFTGDWTYEYFNSMAEKHLGVHLDGGITPLSGQLVEQFPAAPPEGFPFVRRWDGACILKRQDDVWTLATGRDRGVVLTTSSATDADGHVSLAGGVVVIQLSTLRLELPLADRTFVAGDYWLASVREAVHQPGDHVLMDAAPLGIRHHYLALDTIDDAGAKVPRDRDLEQRLDVPSLTTLEARDIDYTPACPSGLFDPAHDTVQKALDRVCTIDATQIAFTPPCETSLFEHVALSPVKTVADALALLCNVRADEIAYTNDAECTVLSNAKTVQEAIHKLCLEKTTTGPCVTIGEGGRFPSLNEALDFYLPRGADPRARQLCFCLLPGDHVLNDAPNLRAHPNQGLHFSLKGCGPASPLRLDSQIAFEGITSVRLVDLTIRMESNATLRVRGGEEVAIDGCKFTVSSPFFPTPIHLSATGTVHLSRNVLGVVSFERLVIGRVIFATEPKLANLFSESATLDAFQKQADEVIPAIADFSLKDLQGLSKSINEAVQAQKSKVSPQEKLTLREQSRLQDIVALLGSGDKKTLSQDLRKAVPQVYSMLLGRPELTPIAVVEATGSDVTLTDNRIVGLLYLYGEAGHELLTSVDLTSLAKRIVKDKSILQGAGESSLMMARNRISAIRLGSDLIKHLTALAGLANPKDVVTGLFHTTRWTDNVFTEGDNELICIEATLVGNRFASDNHNLGSIVARTAYYLGNHGDRGEAYPLTNLAPRTTDHATRYALNSVYIL